LRISECGLRNENRRYLIDELLCVVYTTMFKSSNQLSKYTDTSLQYAFTNPKSEIRNLTPEDARKDGHVQGRSGPFMKYPGKPFLFRPGRSWFCLDRTNTHTVQEILFHLHAYCLGWTHLSANATALAVGEIYLNGYSPIDSAIRTIKPAKVTSVFLFFTGCTLAEVDDRPLCPPIPGGARLPTSQCGTGRNKLILFWGHDASTSPLYRVVRARQ
jgi:hypothetical protein